MIERGAAKLVETPENLAGQLILQIHLELEYFLWPAKRIQRPSIIDA
jgi:hypothetical protein